VLQSPAVEKLHHDERLSILVADVMNGGDVWMVEGGGSERFALEPLQRLRILSQVRGEELQGDVPVQPQVLGFVHHTHASAAQQPEDVIVRNGLADQVPPRSIDSSSLLISAANRGSERSESNPGNPV
jgi:hypothetical protein